VANKRLTTFGCSYTYGEGLSDCVNNGKKRNPLPSEYSWPNLLSKKRNITVRNLSVPGHSNKFIAENIRRTNFRRGDVVIILWTHFTRSCIIDISPRDDLGWEAYKFVSEFDEDMYIRRLISSNAENPLYNNANKHEHRWTKEFYKQFYFSYDIFLQDLESINHIYLYLKRLGVVSYHVLCDTVPFEIPEVKGKYINFPSWNVVPLSSIDWDKVYSTGVALDGHHPNSRGQKEILRQILDASKF